MIFFMHPQRVKDTIEYWFCESLNGFTSIANPLVQVKFTYLDVTLRWPSSAVLSTIRCHISLVHDCSCEQMVRPHPLRHPKFCTILTKRGANLYKVHALRS